MTRSAIPSHFARGTNYRTAQTRTLTSTSVTTYTYDTADRLTSVNGVAYTWDDNPPPLRFQGRTGTKNFELGFTFQASPPPSGGS